MNNLRLKIKKSTLTILWHYLSKRRKTLLLKWTQEVQLLSFLKAVMKAAGFLMVVIFTSQSKIAR
jgi:hypothetical protein